MLEASHPLLLSTCTVIGLSFFVGTVGLLPEIQRASDRPPASFMACCLFEQGNLAIAACHSEPPHATQGWRYFLASSERGTVPRVPKAWSHFCPSSIARAAENQVFVGCWDGSIYSINVSSPEAPPELIGRNSKVIPDLLAYSSDGTLLAVGPKRITAWDVHAKSALWSRSLLAGCLAIHPGGETAVCGTNEGNLLELELNSGLTRRSTAFGSGLVELRFSPNGNFLALVESQGRFTLLQWPSLSPAWEGESQLCGTGSFIAFSSDSRLLAATTQSGCTIAIWDVAKRGVKSHCSDGLSPIVGATFVDDRHLAAWSLDGILRFWDVSSGVLEREIVFTNLEPAS